MNLSIKPDAEPSSSDFVLSRAPVTPVSTAAATGAEVATLLGRVETLTDENQVLKREIATLKKRVAAAASAASEETPPSKKARTHSQKKRLFKKKVVMAEAASDEDPSQKKRELFVKWANALISETGKHREPFDMFKPDSCTIKVNDEGILTPSEFHDLFDGHGELVQPRPDNKPKAIVTILRFETYEDIKRFFEDVGGAEIAERGYEVQLWRRKMYGGFHQYETADARVHDMEVHYNRTRQNLKLVFSLVYGGLYDPDHNSSREESSSELSDSGSTS